MKKTQWISRILSVLALTGSSVVMANETAPAAPEAAPQAAAPAQAAPGPYNYGPNYTPMSNPWGGYTYMPNPNYGNGPSMPWGNSAPYGGYGPFNNGPFGNSGPFGGNGPFNGGPFGNSGPFGNNGPFNGGPFSEDSNPFGNMWGGQNPLQNPFDHGGRWADGNFRPWSTGPFERNKWNDHPMKSLPWGSFPGWGDGFFGGFGPDSWNGVTPWGNDVPFRWIDPTDPRYTVGEMWDDAINTPNLMGRMPPGWTAPYISVPNPIDVEEEFERNARKFPDEMRKMWQEGSSDFGNGEGGNGEGGEQRAFIEPVAPVEPVGKIY